MRIGVAGISGRMGRLVADAVLASEASLVGGTSRRGAPDGVAGYATALALAEASDVVIDFSHADTAASHAAAVAEGRAAWILGTTGLSVAGQEAVEQAARLVPVVQAANFSAGVTLVLALARQLARALPGEDYDAEILEMHHRGKRDAPSGTALALGHAVAAGRGVTLADVAQRARDGETGARLAGRIGFASLRGGQVVGDHTLLFAGETEHISLTHHALDRAVFARGAVRAAFWAGRGRLPGLYGMTDVLGMTPADRGQPA